MAEGITAESVSNGSKWTRSPSKMAAALFDVPKSMPMPSIWEEIWGFELDKGSVDSVNY